MSIYSAASAWTRNPHGPRPFPVQFRFSPPASGSADTQNSWWWWRRGSPVKLFRCLLARGEKRFSISGRGGGAVSDSSRRPWETHGSACVPHFLDGCGGGVGQG